MLARLLRTAGQEATASAAEASATQIELRIGRRDDLLTIYRTRHQLQLEAERPGAAAQIAEFLRVLEAHPDERVLGCSISDDEHLYAVWLDRSAEAVLAVLVPPRGPSGDVDSR